MSKVRVDGDEYVSALMPKNSILGSSPFHSSTNTIYLGQAIALSIMLSIEIEHIERMLKDNSESVEALLDCSTVWNLES